MKEVNVSLKFVTPAFIGAVENKIVSEFRLPSLKGLLRFWWRAYQDFSDETKLYEAESQIFGDTTCKAKFSISLKQPLQSLIRNSNSQKQAFSINQAGIRYLFYSMYKMGKSPGRINWIEPGTTVDLQFRFFNKQGAKEVITALWWLENLGGIGARARRGAGSFRVTKIEPIEEIQEIPQFMCQKWSPKTEKIIENVLGFLESGINKSYCPNSLQVPSYTAFRRSISKYKVLSLGRYTSWEKAADDIGTKLCEFPDPPRPPHSARFPNGGRALHSFASSGIYPKHGSNPLDRSAIGLPIQYYFRDRLQVEALGSVHSRRASPLFIKIGYLPDENKYYVVVSALWSKFLPDGERVKILKKDPDAEHYLKQPDNFVIDDFLNSL